MTCASREESPHIAGICGRSVPCMVVAAFMDPPAQRVN
jgi:hypothetical protein